MPPKRTEPKVTENVKKALATLLDDEKLLLDLHVVFARLYEKANVKLTRAEKSSLFSEIAAEIASGHRPIG
ncbi:MAG: hypothetical protein LAO05_07705 [Acidobacteriia bacterium]|nr:hypothetical protein [Terriglobia bacterium]